MSDNIKITTPLPPSDPVGKIRPKDVTGLVPQIDPGKVTSKAQQSTDQQQSSPEYQFNQQSVYEKFLQQFQQRIGRFRVHGVRFVDNTDFLF